MRSGSNSSHSDVRASALWGAGSRKGEHRSSALWGKGGRRVAGALLAVVVLSLPLAAAAGDGKGSPKGAKYVSPGLLQKAHENPGTKVRIIVQSNKGLSDAKNALAGAGSLKKELKLIGAVAVEVPAAKVDELAKVEGLTITPDAPVKSTGLPPKARSSQLYPFESGNSAFWNATPSAPTIAIVDSGVDTSRVDFAGHVFPQVNLSTLSPNATGDGRGHGTFVAGIAAGSALGMTGAAPGAKILPIRVMDDNGVAMTSDVIRAAEFIYENKAKYNIRVANFSLHSSMPSQFVNDPLDKAVEKLWFSGVVVVAAAGNYGSAGLPTTVKSAPGNDPFVITVGAADLKGTLSPADDKAAEWSVYGYTYDGFAKPEVGAPGRYMVGPVSANATLVKDKPANVVSPGYMQLSGTSFAAPVVAGAAAQILVWRPTWTPDQVKGALMKTAMQTKADPRSLGVGEINAVSAVMVSNPPNANAALSRFVVSASDGGGKVFDAASWADAVKADASWADASWADASWADASWSAASWADASWADASWADGAMAAASWADASWADASWADASWADTSVEDAAEGDAASEDAFVISDEEVALAPADLPFASPVSLSP
jgi:serine protease AprX